MKRSRALTISILAVVAFAVTAVAVAANRHAPRVDPVLATFSFASAHEKQRFCTGEDGPYIEIRAHHEGTQTGDPRLTGKLKLEAHNLVNLATGLGTSEGTFTVRDPATNALKVKGKYHGIFTEGSKFHGLSTGLVKDRAGESETITLFKADVDLATGVVSGQLGGASADPRHRRSFSAAPAPGRGQRQAARPERLNRRRRNHEKAHCDHGQDKRIERTAAAFCPPSRAPRSRCSAAPSALRNLHSRARTG